MRRVAGFEVWLSVFVAAGALYAATASRGAQWQDSGWHLGRIMTGDISHSLGIALTHPLHYHLGRAFFKLLPLEPGLSITLLSAFAAAIAVANIALLIWRFTNQRWATAIGTLSIALAHTFWQHATHTESYTIVAALLTAEWLCIERFAATRSARWLIALFLFNGLGVGNHMLAALATPIDFALLGIFVAKSRKHWLPAFGCVAVWILGCIPLLLLMYRDFQSGGELGATIHSAVFGKFAGSVLNTSMSMRSIGFALGFIVYNFPGPAIPLAIYGAVRGRAQLPLIIRRVFLAQFAIFTVFVIRYAIVDQYSYFFVVYLFIAIFAGIGVSRLIAEMQMRNNRLAIAILILTTVWTPAVYWATATTFASRKLLASAVGNKPYRDGYRTMLIPWGAGDDHAAVLNRKLQELCGDRGTIMVEDAMISFGVQYAKAVGQLPKSVAIVKAYETPTSVQLTTTTNGPIILVPRDRDRPEIKLDRPWRRDGDVYVLSE